MNDEQAYKQLTVKYNPHYETILEVIPIVKQFIRDNNLIIYGGTAIDFALRLHGDAIYDEDTLAVPDLDFYSPAHAEHAYQLADILFAAGHKDARAIVGIYTRIMKVDVIDSNFIADIAYIPADVFGKLPYIEYDGMRVIYPDFQRVDIHSSLSMPYGEPPQEVIFNRWNKDTKRFNILNKYYPISMKAALPAEELKLVVIPAQFASYIFAGGISYAFLYEAYKAIMGAKVNPAVIPGRVNRGEKVIEVDTFRGEVEFLHHDPEKLADELELTGVECFEPYINLLTEQCRGRDSEDHHVTIHSGKNRLIVTSSAAGGMRFAGVQWLLKYLLAKSYTASTAFLHYYVSVMTMIRELDATLTVEQARECPLFLSINVSGRDNYSLLHEVAINRLRNDLENEPRFVIPRNYNAARGGPDRHPEFDPSASHIFRESGKKIEHAAKQQ